MDLKPPSIDQVLSSALLPQEKTAAIPGRPSFEEFTKNAQGGPYGSYGYGPDQEQSYAHGMLPAAGVGAAMGLSNAAHGELSKREFLRWMTEGRAMKGKATFEKTLGKEMAAGGTAFTPEAQRFSRAVGHQMAETPLRRFDAKTPANLGASALTALKKPGTMAQIGLGAGAGALGTYLYNRLTDKGTPPDQSY